MKLDKDSLAIFRNILDPKDPFILQHETKSMRQHSKRIPAELKSDADVRGILECIFPKLEEGKQRVQAGRWLRVIQLHYRFHFSEKATADEMGLPVSTIKGIKTRIRRALQGRRLDGSGCYWKRRRKE